MRPILRWSGIALGVSVCISLVALAAFYVVSERLIDHRYPLPQSSLRVAKGAQAVMRGGHLAHAYGCTDCHGRDLRGAFIPGLGMWSRNLTVLAKSFSDADFDRVIHDGLKPDGASVAEAMPSDAFRYMPDQDAADIIAYIRSLPAAGASPPEPSYGWKQRYDFLFGHGRTDVMWFAAQKPALDLGPSYSFGRRLAMTACGECHTTMLSGNPGDTPDLTLVASYEKSDFFKLMRTGKAAGNREVGMMSQVARGRFRNFSDEEIGAIYDYLAARGRKLTGSGG